MQQIHYIMQKITGQSKSATECQQGLALMFSSLSVAALPMIAGAQQLGCMHPVLASGKQCFLCMQADCLPRGMLGGNPCFSSPCLAVAAPNHGFPNKGWSICVFCGSLHPHLHRMHCKLTSLRPQEVLKAPLACSATAIAWPPQDCLQSKK